MFDHPAQLLVGLPTGVHAVVLGPRPQYEVDHLVAEILGIGDTRRLLDLLQFVIERLAIKQLASLGVAVLLILNPEISIGDIAVENVLAILGVGLKISRLNLLADEINVARRQELLDITQIALKGLFW